MPVYVNSWSTVDAAQVAMLECLMGRAPWRGSNPVDAFCGLEDARF